MNPVTVNMRPFYTVFLAPCPVWNVKPNLVVGQLDSTFHDYRYGYSSNNEPRICRRLPSEQSSEQLPAYGDPQTARIGFLTFLCTESSHLLHWKFSTYWLDQVFFINLAP